MTIAVADAGLMTLLQESSVDLVPIGGAGTVAAIAAHARYGTGTGHPAPRSVGDCFAHTCAATHRAALLYQGDDLFQTDLA